MNPNLSAKPSLKGDQSAGPEVWPPPHSCMLPLAVNYQVQDGHGDEREEKAKCSMIMMVPVRIKRFYEGNHLL